MIICLHLVSHLPRLVGWGRRTTTSDGQTPRLFIYYIYIYYTIYIDHAFSFAVIAVSVSENSIMPNVAVAVTAKGSVTVNSLCFH